MVVYLRKFDSELFLGLFLMCPKMDALSQNNILCKSAV